jgi:hypothetical protein
MSADQRSLIATKNMAGNGLMTKIANPDPTWKQAELLCALFS